MKCLLNNSFPRETASSLPFNKKIIITVCIKTCTLDKKLSQIYVFKKIIYIYYSFSYPVTELKIILCVSKLMKTKLNETVRCHCYHVQVRNRNNIYF